jgi:hypothetical protein
MYRIEERPNPPLTRTNTIINVVVGLVATKAVDLILRFDVKGVHPKALAAALDATPRVGGVTGVGGSIFDPPSGVTISGFPTILNTSTEILVDAGLSVSSLLQGTVVTPPVSTFTIGITIPGHPDVNLEIAIVRPPVLGMGAFTIPAVPLTVIYAPRKESSRRIRLLTRT